MHHRTRSHLRRTALALLIALVSTGLQGCCSMSSSMDQLKGFIAALAMMQGQPPFGQGAPAPNAPQSTDPSAAPGAPGGTAATPASPAAPQPPESAVALAADEGSALATPR